MSIQTGTIWKIESGKTMQVLEYQVLNIKPGIPSLEYQVGDTKHGGPSLEYQACNTKSGMTMATNNMSV